MRRLLPRTTAAASAVVIATTIGCLAAGGQASAGPKPVIDPGDGGSYQPDVDAEDFVAGIDNPYLPLLPGARWVYEGEEDGEVERTEVVVTDLEKEILGIDVTVVRDTVTLEGELVEDTLDWFAQDEDGNVWYLGEETAEYENGEVVSTEGSWEAGVDGAQPGIVMLAEPERGDAYRQEYDPGNAEDMAEVVRIRSRDDVLVTREWTPLEPDVVEEKRYEPGVGLVLEIVKRGGHGRTELVEHTPGGST